MSRNLNQKTSMMRSNEDIGSDLMEKLAEKRKFFEEAQAMYNGLCANVDKLNVELTEIEMERFKVEGLRQESEIRVKVFEKWEKEQRDEAERAGSSIKEAEIRQKEERAVRDAHNKGFIGKVKEMAEGYCRFKRNCDRKNVSESLQDLRARDVQVTDELEKIVAEIGIEEDGNRVSLVSADPQVEGTLDNIRNLQRHLEYDTQCAESSNANLQAETDQLGAQKNALQKEIEALTEILEK